MKPIKVVKDEAVNNTDVKIGNIIVEEDCFGRNEYLVVGLGGIDKITLVDLSDGVVFESTVESLDLVLNFYFEEDEVIEILEIDKIVAKPT